MFQHPYTGVIDAQRAAWEQATEVAETLGAVPDANEAIADVDVGQTPSEVVYEENKLQLIHYEPLTEEQHDVPILIVYALINRPYILDLQPNRSVVRTLLENGFDVYLIDWGEPSKLDTSLTLEDYVVRYVDNCVDEVRERSGQDSINVLGYCMGGTMASMYAALEPEKVRNLGLMAAGLCFAGEGGVLELWGDEDYFDPEAVTETFGNVPAEFLDTGFALMDPVENYVTKYVRFYDNIEDEDFVENFARMEEWLGDGIDVAGTAFEEFIEDIYQENKLYENELTLGGRDVDVEAIDMPVLQIVAEYDHLIPPGASKPFNDVVGSDDVTTMEFPTGHIGMSVSSRSHGQLWPDVCAWFEERSQVEAEPGDGAEASSAAGPSSGAAEADEESQPAEVDGEAPSAEPEEAAPEQDDSIDAEAPAETEVDSAEAAGLQAIEGIGPAYEERLVDAGITTMAALADADAAALAAETEVAPNRILSWIEQAERRVD